MRARQAIAALALVGVLMSVYLTMFKLGMVGTLMCGGSGSCEIVQLGPWGALFGVPVAAYGVAGYLAIMIVAMAGLQKPDAGLAGNAKLLTLLSGAGVAFSAYLTYLELFRIHAICRWCVGSACLITVIFVLSFLSLRTLPSASPRPRDPRAS